MNTFDQLIILFHEVSEEGEGYAMELIEGMKEKQKTKERDACKCFCFAKKTFDNDFEINIFWNDKLSYKSYHNDT